MPRFSCFQARLAAPFVAVVAAVAPLTSAVATEPAAFPATAPGAVTAATAPPANVIFLHPDGTGLGHWGALRFLQAGPDGALAWDKLPHMAVYTGHMKDAATGTSNGGATVHAYGVKVVAESFGLDGKDEITSASGQKMSIMEEAMAAGRAVGVVQTGHIAEPGSAAFLASVTSRRNVDEIARQVVQSGAPVILGGGEAFLLPKGVKGRHGEGARADGLDLVAWATGNGYTIVYTREELAAVDTTKVTKLLGLFAAGHTFNDKTEEENAAAGRPNYVESAPTVAQMADVAVKILARDPDGFFLVVEEEGTDNFGNKNNAPGTLEALRRADEAVALLHDYVTANPNTLLLMAADSDAGGMHVIGPDPKEMAEIGATVPERSKNGAPLDGVGGTKTAPFLSAPDKASQRWPFAVAWATEEDTSGAILARAAGRNGELVRGKVDNTDIYKIMYRTLFGRTLP